ncbi:electron transfer flavoprotein subunit alpha/FixB family protein [candidate division KSB1 bacterium]
MSQNVFIYCETNEGKLAKSSYEVSSTGRNIAAQTGGKLTAAVINCDKDQVNLLADYGVNKVHNITNENLKDYTTEGYAAVLKEVIESENAEIVIMSATRLGKDLAPRLAAKLNTDLVPDVIELKWEGGSLIAKRPVFAGKALITVKPKMNPQFVTIRQNIFKPEQAKSSDFEAVETTPSAALNIRTAVKEILKEAGEVLDVAEADIIVSGGRGIKGPENFKMLEDLASFFGAAVGASRAAVDADWIDHSHQVGQTGKVVNPTLYIACGISGAIQHLAGMRTSKYIVAINKDPDAPIFKIADYGIVGDIFEVVPEMVKQLKEMQ